MGNLLFLEGTLFGVVQGNQNRATTSNDSLMAVSPKKPPPKKVPIEKKTPIWILRSSPHGLGQVVNNVNAAVVGELRQASLARW